ncbi:unnamed protein product, partial [Ectocarpus sp. 12 AP-2014]
MVGVSLPYTGKAVVSGVSRHAGPRSRGGGDGRGRAALSTASGRDHSVNALAWDGPAEDPRERGRYARFKSVRESRHMHGPIRGMDLEMPPGMTRKYRTSSGPLKSGGATLLTDSSLERGAKEAGNGDGRTGGGNSS